MSSSKSVSERFWEKVEKTDGCWMWTASLFEKGYGQFTLNGRNRRAHRVAYEMAHGEVPSDLQINHLCGNPSCVRPDHLYAGTQSQNMRDKVSHGNNEFANKTHCPQGHPYDNTNTSVRKTGSGVGRSCRACDAQRHRERRALAS
jgi:hypothetical protein